MLCFLRFFNNYSALLNSLIKSFILRQKIRAPRYHKILVYQLEFLLPKPLNPLHELLHLLLRQILILVKLPSLYFIHLCITADWILVFVLYLLVCLLPQKLFLNCLQFFTPMFLQPLKQQILIHRRKLTSHLTHLILLWYVTHLHQWNILL